MPQSFLVLIPAASHCEFARRDQTKLHPHAIRVLDRQIEVRCPCLLMFFCRRGVEGSIGGWRGSIFGAATNGGRSSWQAFSTDPRRADNLAVMVIARGVAKHIASTFVETIKCKRLGIGLEVLLRREVFFVSCRLGNPHLVQRAVKSHELFAAPVPGH